jgi:transposase
MPAESTVRFWAVEDRNGFAAQYARAREAQVEAMGEDLIEIADNNTGDPQRDRLRVDARKWLMSKVAPKKYGDKVETVHSGSVEVTKITRTIVRPQ